MENFVRNSKQNIEKEIERIERQPIAPLDKIKQIIDVIQMSLILLKSAVAEYQFPNPKEEILFFRILSYCYHFKSMREITRELNNDHGMETTDFRAVDVLCPLVSD